MAGPTHAEKEREAVAQRFAKLTPVREEAVKEEVQSAVGQQQKAAERVVGMTAQLFANAVNKDPALKMAVRDSQLNTFLDIVRVNV